MTLSIIVAMSHNRVIGVNNDLPWRLPADLKRFRRITMGKPIVMGRRTHESIGRPLPGRENIIITRNPVYTAPGCLIKRSLDEALSAFGDAAEVVVIGGASLYAEALHRAGRIYLTLVHAEVAGDTYFPQLDARRWREVSREYHAADTEHAYAHSLIVLERRGVTE